MKNLILPFILIGLLGCSNTSKKGIVTYYNNGKEQIAIDTIDGKFNGILSYLDKKGDTLVKQIWDNGFLTEDIYVYNAETEKPYKKTSQLILLYDSTLVKFYRSHLSFEPDSLFQKPYLKQEEKHTFTFCNFPQKMCMIQTNNGSIKPLPEHYFEIKIGKKDSIHLQSYTRIKTGKFKVFDIKMPTKK